MAAATTGTVTNNNATVTLGTGFDDAIIANGNISATFKAGAVFESDTVNGTLASHHDLIDVSGIAGAAGAITDFSSNAGVTGATSLANAEQFVATTLGAPAVGYFTWADGNEYVVATSATPGVFGSDMAVQLIGGAFHHSTIAAGVITLVI